VRRLVIALVAILVLVLFGVLAGVVIAKPLLEERLADEIGAQVGVPVEVSMELDRFPGGFAGRVGDVEITAERLERQGLEFEDLRVTVDEADVNMLDLARGTANIGWQEVRLQVGLREEEIQRYAAPRLANAGVPNGEGLQVRVVPSPEGIYARIPGVEPVRVVVRVVGDDRIRLQVQGRSAAALALRAVLPQALDVGPLPLGLRLTGVRYGQGILFVEGTRGPGSETFG
jgi:hypothetical protein